MQGSPSAHPAERGQPVRIVSAPLAGEIAVLFCGPLEGLLTHRVHGRPHGCPGPESCPTAHHKGPTVWYGYAPARVWRPREEDWQAAAVEITEALEEQLRGRRIRGELWLMRRDTSKRKQGPVHGVLLERRAEEDTPPAFDVRPALYRLYHTTALLFGVPNPLPAKVVLPAVRLAPPPSAESYGLAEAPRPTAIDAEALRRLAPRGLAAAAAEAAQRNGHEKR